MLLLVGCNEEVSPSLESNSSSSGGNGNQLPPAETPSSYYFRVVNTASVLFNYRLHKTGNGNMNAACGVTKTTPLTSAIYTSGDPDSDITCFMEAEELALFFNGLAFNIEASTNTCEYVAYSPYSFYDYRPGSSSTTLTRVTCMNQTTTDAHAASVGAPTYGPKCNVLFS